MVVASFLTVTSTVSSPSICMSSLVAAALSFLVAVLSMRTATCSRTMRSSMVCAPPVRNSPTVVEPSRSAAWPSPIWSPTMSRAVSFSDFLRRRASPDAMPPLRPFSLASLSL